MPPVTRTRPFASRVAVWNARAVVRGATVVQVWVVGEYTSALFRYTKSWLPFGSPVRILPPTTRTRPSASRVWLWQVRGLFMGVSSVQVAGAWNSLTLVRLFPEGLL